MDGLRVDVGSLDLKPDLDNANVGKYMSEMNGSCVPLLSVFLCELGAPLFTECRSGAGRYRKCIVRCFLYHEEIFPECKADYECLFYSQVSWKGELGYGKDQRRRKAA